MFWSVVSSSPTGWRSTYPACHAGRCPLYPPARPADWRARRRSPVPGRSCFRRPTAGSPGLGRGLPECRPGSATAASTPRSGRRRWRSAVGSQALQRVFGSLLVGRQRRHHAGALAEATTPARAPSGSESINCWRRCRASRRVGCKSVAAMKPRRPGQHHVCPVRGTANKQLAAMFLHLTGSDVLLHRQQRRHGDADRDPRHDRAAVRHGHGRRPEERVLRRPARGQAVHQAGWRRPDHHDLARSTRTGRCPATSPTVRPRAASGC